MTHFLRLPAEPNGYDHSTPLPAPAWLVDATPGVKPLAKAFADTKEAALTANRARRDAILAFREASRTDRDNNLVPLPSVEYDRWRQMKAAKEDAEAAERATSREVKRAWHALRDHIAESDEALAAAEDADQERIRAAAIAAGELKSAVARLREARALVSNRAVIRPSLHDLERLSRDAGALFNPEQPWTFTRREVTK